MGLNNNSIFGDDIQQLYKLMQKTLSPAKQYGNLTRHPIIEDYLNDVVSRFSNLHSLKVVLDAGNGTASTVAPELFKRVGAKVFPLYCKLDGTFPNHHPDPTVPKNLVSLIDTVKKEQADIGFAFDGDSDRIGLVNELGEIIYGDELMILLSRAVLREHPKSTIISEVKSSHRLYHDIEAHGGNGIMWKTGHSIIKTKMKETNAVLAGEMSGHIFFADRYFGFDDALYAALRVYEIVSKAGVPLSSLLSDLPKTFNTPEIRLDCDDLLKFDLVEKVKAALNKDYDINDIDGVRVEFDSGWGLVRASNTQPAIVLRFEASTQEKLDEYKTIIKSILDHCVKEVGHAPIKFE
jgi:phosphomannomutase/phosphoglucomutase